jgi:Ca2+-binding RTX toxin-like protein
LVTGLATGASSTDTLISIENLTGSPYADSLTGDGNANALDGGGGNDTLNGLAGNDSLSGAAGDDTLDGGAGNDILDGGTGADVLTGGEGDDILDGGTGADVLTGGDGDDTYTVDDSGDQVVETLAGPIGGTDLVYTTLASYLLPAEVENGQIRSAGGANLVGNGLANVLLGFDGNDTLDGGAGDDLLDGNAGNDILDGHSGNDTLGGNTGDDTLSGAAGSDILNGGTGKDLLDGGEGNDTLDGGLPSVQFDLGFYNAARYTDGDTMRGGAGDDLYVVTVSSTQQYLRFHYHHEVEAAWGDAPDLVVENPDEGSDTVHAYVSYSLPDHVENLVLQDESRNIDGTGNDLDNVLTGNSGANVLDGAGGNDTIDGGAGNDTVSYAGAVAAVSVTLATPGVQQNTVSAGLDTLTGIENLIGSGFNDALTGDAGNNALQGGTGNDTLDGGGGADTLTGGDGSDFYYIDHLGDQVTETNATGAGGTDLVLTTLASYTLGSHVENGRILAAGAANLTGNALNNLLYAGIGSNVLDGGAGTDCVSWAYGVTGSNGVTASLTGGTASGSGDDTLIGIECLIGSPNADTLSGDGNANSLDGAAGNDTLYGGAGNDTLTGGSGADSLTGGDGSDHYYIDHLGDQVNETNATAAGGTDLVHTTLASYTLGNHVENGRILASGAANLTGNALNNLLYAGTGNNLLDGGAGSDTVTWAYAVSGASGVTASLASGTASGSGSDTLIGIEHLIGSPNAGRLTGDGNANHLSGGLGNDTLDGGAGADTLTGGDGNDHYYIDHLGDQVIETNASAAGGIDLVHTTLASYTLGNHVENGRILASGAANLSGNALDNLLYAGTGNNVLDGGAGSDTVTWAYGVSGAVGVTASLASGSATGSGLDTLIGIEHLIGSANADRLTGDGNANNLSGGLGNDTLDGGAGADTLTGGDGNDHYYIDHLGDQVIETNATAAGGTDLVHTTLASYTLGNHVENGRILASGAANLTGNALNNLLYAGTGNNVLDGGAGSDTVTWAYGVSGAVGVTASLASGSATGSGSDTLIGIEHLIGSANADRLTGDGNANTSAAASATTPSTAAAAPTP